VPRRRDPAAGRVVYRTARVGLRLTATKARRRATAARAPTPGQRGSRRWRKTRRRARQVEGRHRRRIRQAQHEAATTVINWAVQRRIGTLIVGDPRGLLQTDAGRRHNLRQWQPGVTHAADPRRRPQPRTRPAPPGSDGPSAASGPHGRLRPAPPPPGNGESPATHRGEEPPHATPGEREW